MAEQGSNPEVPTEAAQEAAPEAELPCSVELNKTFIHDIIDVSFDNLPKEQIYEIFKDGRPFSHFIERWLPEQNYPLVHILGCKDHDFTDLNYPVTRYDEKTFTKGGCKFCPSNMIGQGRKFDEEKFREKSRTKSQNWTPQKVRTGTKRSKLKHQKVKSNQNMELRARAGSSG